MRLWLGDGHAPFDVPEAIRIALLIKVLRLAREQRQRDRREEKKPHYFSMSDLDGFGVQLSQPLLRVKIAHGLGGCHAHYPTLAGLLSFQSI